MADVTVKINDDGPYLISGDFEVLDPEGKKYTWEGAAAALCRCGSSENKPFCDGAHKAAGFEDTSRAT